MMEEQEKEMANLQEPTKGYENLALVTIMGAKINPDSNKHFGLLAFDKVNKQVLHYAENADLNISDIANWGVYFFSVRIFAEYGMNPYYDDFAGEQDTESLANITDGCSTPMAFDNQIQTPSGSESLK